MRMQKHASQSEVCKGLVELPIAVAFVAGHRMTEMRGMHPYLMCPAGGDRGFDERRARAEAVEQAEGASC